MSSVSLFSTFVSSVVGFVRFRLRPFAFAFRFRLAPGAKSPLHKHLTSRGSQPLVIVCPAQHSCELVHPIFALEPPNADAVRLRSTRFSISKCVSAHAAICGRCVMHKHLERRAECLKLAADDVGDPPADAGVDLVEY